MKYFLSFYLILIVFHLQAKTIYINAQNSSGTQNGNSWSAGFKTLKTGIAAAKDNDEVWITADNYTIRTAAGADTSENISIMYSIKIYGGFSGTETSISQRKGKTTIVSGLAYAGSDTTRSINLFLLGKSVKISFDHLTFSGINSSGTDNDKGGAILIDTLSVVRFNNCIFTDNKSLYRVSCLNSKGGSEVFMDSCTFALNGQAYAFIFTYDDTKFHISNSNIYKNPNTNSTYFYINGATDFDIDYPGDTLVTADHINFHDNDGMNFIQRDKGSVICSNSNFSMGSGNAIYTGDGEGNFTLIDNCNFSPGTPENYVVYNYKNALTISNSTFDGGLLSYDIGIVNTQSSVKLINTTFKNFSNYLLSVNPEVATDQFLIDGCTFEGNTYNHFYTGYTSSTIQNTTFRNNNFGNGNYALFSCYGKKLVMKNNLITGNSVSNNIPLIDTYQVDSTIVDSCTFVNNQTKNWPLFTADSGEYLRFAHTKFLGNFSEYDYMPDGIIVGVYDGKFSSYSNLYKGNHSVGVGGSGVADVEGNAVFLNDIFDGNSADSSAAFTNSGNLVVANCDFLNQNDIVIRNITNYNHYHGKADFINSAISGKSASDYYNYQGLHLSFDHCYSSNVLPGTGNIQSNIYPVDTNYLANPAGPVLVNKGVNLPDSISTGKDYYGFPRIIGIIDIGATENQNLTVATDPENLFSKTYLYPNPSPKEIVKVHTPDVIVKLEIVDLSGEKVESVELQNAELNAATLESGIYFVKIYTTSGSYVEKLLVQ